MKITTNDFILRKKIKELNPGDVFRRATLIGMVVEGHVDEEEGCVSYVRLKNGSVYSLKNDCVVIPLKATLDVTTTTLSKEICEDKIEEGSDDLLTE